MLVDPMGVVRIDLGLAEGVGVGEVDTAYTGRVRATLPSLAGRRTDLLSSGQMTVPG
jgi:predicted amidohydrolase